MAVHAFGNDLVGRLLDSLGLGAANVQKAVIEIPADDVVRVYAVLVPGEDVVCRACEVFETEVIPVADVVVGDDAAVTVTPLG